MSERVRYNTDDRVRHIKDVIVCGMTTTATRKELQQVLLDTSGWMMAQGRMCDIKHKHLGAGAYKVWLEVREGANP